MQYSQHFPSKQALLALLFSLCLCGPAIANTSDANAGPAATHSGQAGAAGNADPHPQLPGSRLRGQAILRFLGIRIYHARLWVGPGFRADKPTEHPAVLELEYLRDFKGADIAQRSLKEMRRAGPLSEAQAQRWLSQMERTFPDIRAGDRLTGHFQPSRGASFWHNGRPTGQVADADFASAFLGIWLASTTSEPAMRQALLGLNEAGKAPDGR
jgi:hypothetical protein